jgi:GrpB-like predicted nucleotidyltransferase (UPF0157 family)
MEQVYFFEQSGFQEKAHNLFVKHRAMILERIPEADIQHVGSTSISEIQLTVINSELDLFWKQRDVLNMNEAYRNKYNQLKMNFEGKSMDDYREAKKVTESPSPKPSELPDPLTTRG